MITNSQVDVKLSDNYVDVLPGRSRKVRLIAPVRLGEIKDYMVYKSYRQVY